MGEKLDPAPKRVKQQNPVKGESAKMETNIDKTNTTTSKPSHGFEELPKMSYEELGKILLDLGHELEDESTPSRESTVPDCICV